MIKIKMDRNCKSYKMILNANEYLSAWDLSANDNFFSLFEAKGIDLNEDIPAGLIGYY